MSQPRSASPIKTINNTIDEIRRDINLFADSLKGEAKEPNPLIELESQYSLYELRNTVDRVNRGVSISLLPFESFLQARWSRIQHTKASSENSAINALCDKIAAHIAEVTREPKENILKPPTRSYQPPGYDAEGSNTLLGRLLFEVPFRNWVKENRLFRPIPVSWNAFQILLKDVSRSNFTDLLILFESSDLLLPIENENELKKFLEAISAEHYPKIFDFLLKKIKTEKEFLSLLKSDNRTVRLLNENNIAQYIPSLAALESVLSNLENEEKNQFLSSPLFKKRLLELVGKERIPSFIFQHIDPLKFFTEQGSEFTKRYIKTIDQLLEIIPHLHKPEESIDFLSFLGKEHVISLLLTKEERKEEREEEKKEDQSPKKDYIDLLLEAIEKKIPVHLVSREKLLVLLEINLTDSTTFIKYFELSTNKIEFLKRIPQGILWKLFQEEEVLKKVMGNLSEQNIVELQHVFSRETLTLLFRSTYTFALTLSVLDTKKYQAFLDLFSQAQLTKMLLQDRVPLQTAMKEFDDHANKPYYPYLIQALVRVYIFQTEKTKDPEPSKWNAVLTLFRQEAQVPHYTKRKKIEAALNLEVGLRSNIKQFLIEAVKPKNQHVLNVLRHGELGMLFERAIEGRPPPEQKEAPQQQAPPLQVARPIIGVKKDQ